MLVLKRLFRFYINASIHVGLAVVSLFIISSKNLNILPNKNLAAFVFFATIVCYNFVKYGVEAEKYLIVAKPYQKRIQVFSFFAFGLSMFFMTQLEPKIWGSIFLLTILSALYAIPFLPNSRNLRSLGGLKIFLIALIWTGFTLVIPALDAELPISKDLWLMGIQRFVLVLVLIIPFEIRDLGYDSPELKTLPQRFGVQKTKVIGYVLIGGYFILEILRTKPQFKEILWTVCAAGILVLVLHQTKKNQSTYFASFWVEGIPVVLLLLLAAKEMLD